MAVCIQKRIYNESTLKSWKGRMSVAWDTFFTKKELNLGREIYRNGEIRELELHNLDIIVHARFDQEECCALIEWNQGSFNIRGSAKDKLLARSLAVAGLYDVEELVSQVEKSDTTSVLARSEDHTLLKSKARKSKKQVEVQEARDLSLEFYLTTQGLHFHAHWRNGAGKVLALKSAENAPSETNALEREKLIGLASVARRSGFKFNSSRGDYVLREVDKIQVFIGEELSKKWKARYSITFGAGAEKLNKGIQYPEICVDLEGSDEGTLDFCWNMNIDGHVLDSDQARHLIRKTGEVVIIPELGMLQLEPQKTDLLATWRKWLNLYSDGKIPRYVLFSSFGEDPIRMTLSTELKKWKDSLFHLPPEADYTETIPSFLRSYQQQGVRWLSHLCDRNCHGLLADEMGLGKTIQVLSFITSRSIYNLPDLIVCPASVVPVWQKEIERFFPKLKVDILKSGNDFYKCDEKIVWISSYTQLRMHKYLLDITEFGYVILDEAQLIKNPEAKVTQACLRIRGKHRIVLTGTPLENKYLDLWTLFRFLMPGLLGTKRHFENKVLNDSKKVRDQIKKQIAPFVLRRTKRDVLKELPDKTEIECICPLTDLQRQEYTRLSKDGVKELGEDLPKAVRERSLSFLTLLTRLRQTCCDPALLPWMDAPVEESGKIMVLMEKLSEILANGHKVVIFSQFVSLLARVQKAIRLNFSDTPIYQLTGKTIDRASPVAGFQEQEGAGVMLVSLRAGGTGITLHSADYVFLMDPWWNPAVEEQAIDRVHRFGQDKPVFVYRMITEGTIEARIQKLKLDKKGIFSGILGEMNDITNMKHYFDSLSDLIALLPEAK